MRTSQLPGVLTPILAQFDLELEVVEVIPAGKRQLLRVVVDGDGATGTGPLLDDLAEASKALSAALDESAFQEDRVLADPEDMAGTGDLPGGAVEFELEGVGHQLELPVLLVAVLGSVSLT